MSTCRHCGEEIIRSLKSQRLWIHKQSRVSKCTSLKAEPKRAKRRLWPFVNVPLEERDV